MNRIHPLILPGLAVLLLVTGCRGVPATGEKAARQELAAVGGYWQSNPPALTQSATLQDVVFFAIKHHPQVTAAYSDWASSVETITVARSLPDPKFTFELYAADVVSSLMPGLSADLPGPGKLSARAAAASAESRSKYFQFAAAVQQTAFGVEKSFLPLHFLEAKLRVNRQTLALLAELEALARAQNEVGQGTLRDVLKAQIEQDKLQTETANLEDSRHVLAAQYKAALGLDARQADPPVPANAEFAEAREKEEDLLATAWKQNPRLQQMEAEIRVAEASIRAARKERIPDFSAGATVDVKASPFIWNPELGMTLPIWRDKIAAEIAAAQNAKTAAEARLSSERIQVAVDFAEQTYLIREADRELELLRGRVLPRARQALEIARAAYRSSRVDFLNVIEDERSLLNFQLEEIAAQTQRELARAERSLLIAGVPPPKAPLLKSDNPPLVR